MECNPDSTSVASSISNVWRGLWSRLDSTRRGGERTNKDADVRRVGGDVLAIDWQPWPRSRQGSGMQIHGRDCELLRKGRPPLFTVVSRR